MYSKKEVENENKSYDVYCYEKFIHTWVIHNSGSVMWQGRKLVFKNSNSVCPRSSCLEIAIPDVEPNGYIKIMSWNASIGI